MLKLNIIYEDKDILVIDKPVGLIVNRASTTTEHTLQDELDQTFPDISEPENVNNEDYTEYRNKSGIVHRLDKDTSGVLLIAKNVEAFYKLRSQFKSRTVEKEYAALVFGEVKFDEVEIDAPIKRNPRNRFKLAVVEEGKPAITRIKKINSIEKEGRILSFLRVFPKTGRTHQIRVHLAALGHPVVGDKVYSGRMNTEFAQKYFTRLMLHAHKISFAHPTESERVTFESQLPDEFSL